MADVNLQLVREFFELNVFHVLTQWQQAHPRHHPGEPGIFLFVENTSPLEAGEPDFVLGHGDIVKIHRAIVDVRAWHGDRVYPSVIESSPILTQLATEKTTAQARAHFGNLDFTTILVVSELPTSQDLRTQTIESLQERGIGHVLEFPIILHDLLDKVSANTTYPASTTLQILRILKRYRFIRNLQMEFSFPTEAPALITVPNVDTAVQPDDDEDNAS